VLRRLSGKARKCRNIKHIPSFRNAARQRMYRRLKWEVISERAINPVTEQTNSRKGSPPRLILTYYVFLRRQPRPEYRNGPWQTPKIWNHWLTSNFLRSILQPEKEMTKKTFFHHQPRFLLKLSLTFTDTFLLFKYLFLFYDNSLTKGFLQRTTPWTQIHY